MGDCGPVTYFLSPSFTDRSRGQKAGSEREGGKKKRKGKGGGRRTRRSILFLFLLPFILRGGEDKRERREKREKGEGKKGRTPVTSSSFHLVGKKEWRLATADSPFSLQEG